MELPVRKDFHLERPSKNFVGWESAKNEEEVTL
jgi:hypothetical protein